MTSVDTDTVLAVPVTLVGAGPAALMVAHPLGRSGIDSIALDTRSRQEIESTQRAGILEADAAHALIETGVSDRILHDGQEHEGIDLRFKGRSHRIHFKELVGESVWPYPQTDVFADLADARQRDGGTVHFGVSDTEVLDVETSAPRVRYTAADGGEDGFTLNAGPIIEKSVLRFRSFVQEPIRWGSLLLAGDAAHTLPPTGARGLNLALHDARVLSGVLTQALSAGSDDPLSEYEQRALQRVWRAQNFSYWMTQLLHTTPDGKAFDVRRQIGELDNIVATRAGQTYLAEQYTGWPTRMQEGPR